MYYNTYVPKNQKILIFWNILVILRSNFFWYMMKRKVFDSLVEWKDSDERKPLILNGARQVKSVPLYAVFCV